MDVVNNKKVKMHNKSVPFWHRFLPNFVFCWKFLHSKREENKSWVLGCYSNVAIICQDLLCLLNLTHTNKNSFSSRELEEGELRKDYQKISCHKQIRIKKLLFEPATLLDDYY